jgi:glycosyltransferase involved in cell wall biosynthesis
MHGSALEEARSATSIGRTLFQAGVYAQELLTALLQRGTVAVSTNTRRLNPFIRRVIPDGIDLRVFRPDATARSLHPSILFVGALTGRKRGAWLLDVFERDVRPAYPQAELHMVTTPGPTRQGVTYHTGIETDALVRLYQYAWVYASPSTYEGFGLPYVEALACGTPVVATPNPGSREVLDGGRFGYLPADNDFGDAICGLLADAIKRGVMARQGLAHAADYDIARTAELYEQVIAELVRSCPTIS